LDGLLFKKNELFKHLLEYGLTPKSIYLGVAALLDEIKKRGFLLACSSSSTNAILQLKKMKLYSKFDYVVDYKAKQVLVLSQREDSELINPAGLVLKDLGLEGSECIGFEHDIDGIQQYKALGIFAVLVGNNNLKDRKQADFNVEFSGEMPLEEIIFNYYKKHAEDKEGNE
jgi:beta-phosphoglucomutase-like phosphatase (HAD superfamily)